MSIELKNKIDRLEQELKTGTIKPNKVSYILKEIVDVQKALFVLINKKKKAPKKKVLQKVDE